MFKRVKLYLNRSISYQVIGGNVSYTVKKKVWDGKVLQLTTEF